GLLSYQWFYNGAPLGGATGASLTVTNAQLPHQGNYTVSVSNSYGTVWTSDAAVLVLIKPRVIRHPVSQTVVAGGSVTLSVSAEGNPLPLSYRWRKNLITQTNIISDSTNGF